MSGSDSDQYPTNLPKTQQVSSSGILHSTLLTFSLAEPIICSRAKLTVLTSLQVLL